jgi:putative lipoic acid-binding regulatory protein
MSSDDDTLFDFPCRFPVKAMGRDENDFETTVVGIVRRHAPDLGEGAVTTQPSRNGRFVSVTVTFTATSRDQLDAIYADLTAHDQVLMAL